MQDSEVCGAAQSWPSWADTALVALVVLACATLYESAAALGALSVGPEPGQGPAGEEVVVAAGLLAVVVGGIACFANAARSGVDTGFVWAFLAPAAAAFVVARFHTFDPYYAPSLRRSSDDGLVSPWWVLALVIAALAAGGLTRARPRKGAIVSCSVLFLTGLTALVVRGGH